MLIMFFFVFVVVEWHIEGDRSQEAYLQTGAGKKTLGICTRLNRYENILARDQVPTAVA